MHNLCEILQLGSVKILSQVKEIYEYDQIQHFW
jgi:hypothetical protein